MTEEDRRLAPEAIAATLAMAGERQELHLHRDARIVVFLAGEMHETALEGHTRFAPGDFVFRPAHFAHANIAGDAGAAYVRITPSNDLVRNWIARHGWRAARGHVQLDKAIRAENVLHAACAPAYRPRRPVNLAQRAALLLRANTVPKVQEIAQRLGIAPYELTRRFFEEFKMTRSEFSPAATRIRGRTA